MPATYEPIASTTLGSAAASTTFSSISGTFTDLRLIVAGAAEQVLAPVLQFNSDTGSNYSRTLLLGNGTAASSSRDSSVTSASVGAFNTDGPHTAIVDIMSYANTNVYKTLLSAASRDGFGVYRIVGLWRSTSAIDTITVLTSNGGNFTSGTTFALYGIKAA